MEHQLEVELKWALCASEHAELGQRLAEMLGPPRQLAQDNRFFDSADARLHRQGCNLRLRLENHDLVLTCKRKAAGVDPLGAHRHDEWEERLDPALWALVAAGGTLPDALLPLPPPLRAALAGSELRALGGFANQRQEFHAQRPGARDLLCLDRTTFAPGRVDHELEIETADPDGAAPHWRSHLASWGVTVRTQGETKFARFQALRRARPAGG